MRLLTFGDPAANAPPLPKRGLSFGTEVKNQTPKVAKAEKKKAPAIPADDSSKRRGVLIVSLVRGFHRDEPQTL